MTLQFLTLLAASGGLVLVGLVYDSGPAYFMFAALVAVIAVSYAATRLSSRAVRWGRRVEDRVFEGEPFRVSIELRNMGRIPRFVVSVRDSLSRFLRSEDPVEAVVPQLWPGEEIALCYEVRALKRGAHVLGPLQISVSDPFGVFQRNIPLQEQGEAVVYPRPVPLGGEVGRSGSEVRGGATGERARGSESGLEFYGIRDYRPGDELRRIHWPATAHHGRLTVLEFDRGGSENLVVLLDTKAGTEFGTGAETSLDVGVRVAASLIHWVLESEGMACLAMDSAVGVRWLAADRLDREYEMLEVLARAKAEGRMTVSELLAWSMPYLPADAHVWIVTAAVDADLADMIGAVRGQHVPVGVVVLDGSAFDPQSQHPAGTQTLSATQAAESLRAVGAAAAVVRQGDSLREVLETVLAVGG